MTSNPIHIVVNPTAGNGKAGKIASRILQKISSKTDFAVDLTFTKEKNDAVQITRKAILNGASTIIAVGGDGTINEVINGFFLDGHPLNPLCELGIINCGTGCGLAKTLNIPQSLDQQVNLILQPGSMTIDLGNVTYQNFFNKKEHRFFASECQIGIGSKVASIVGKRHKIFGGKIAFGYVSTLQAIRAMPIGLQIAFDNEHEQKTDLLGLVVGNGKVCGGGMKLTPGAELNDALFDVLSIHEMSIIQRLLNLSKVYSGNHLLSPHFSLKQCKKISVKSDIDITLEADGEMLGYSPFSVEIIPAAISVKANNTKS